jgi:lycopene cyclase domain-containing protein
MTYLRFHLYFNLPPLLVLGALNAQIVTGWGDAMAFGCVLLAVMIFTTPWDNFAAKWGIWGFPPGRYSRKIWHLPVEEYAFFLLQSVNIMLAIRALFHFFPDWLTGQETVVDSWTFLCLAVSVIPWAVIVWQLRLMRAKRGPKVNYAIHLVWFLPIIYAQWILAPPLFMGHSSLLSLMTGTFGVYYSLADLVAVRAGVWFFDQNQITGFKVARLLPWEEVAFFYLTTLLVTQSYLLLLPSDMR